MTKSKIAILLKKYSKILHEVENAYCTMPSGYLRINNRGNSTMFYCCHKNGSDATYLKKNNPEDLKKIELLANKKYLFSARRVLRKNVDVLCYANKKMSDESLSEVYDKLPDAIKEYVLPYEYSDDEYAKRWNKKAYAQSTSMPERKIYGTKTGINVRSKSEMIIANQLTDAGLFYKYEKYTKTNEGTFFPDFTVLNKKTREEYIWEHFGLMDNEDYRTKAFRKIQILTKYCLDNQKKFIATFESNDVVLNTEYISSIIRSNFGTRSRELC